ncbi:diphthine--ammonia ligase isoform X1 [Silurus asotus]|uniref:Diphthine--ammonia ligase n=1 Tax=Silurus asotus TaxID=30991 RepID=A0AAD5ALG7_SILAS|nr:diphthine--ammonia ligase isoform X1 [Silurus asotus]
MLLEGGLQHAACAVLFAVPAVIEEIRVDRLQQAGLTASQGQTCTNCQTEIAKFGHHLVTAVLNTCEDVESSLFRDFTPVYPSHSGAPKVSEAEWTWGRGQQPLMWASTGHSPTDGHLPRYTQATGNRAPAESACRITSLFQITAEMLYTNEKEKEHVEAVSVGAILSDYQRVRVENVCSRLQLQPLAYLWRREQADLLSEMITSGLQAVLIKVAAYGLNPGTHLGKTLAEMEPYLHQLSKKYGVHICGEGGEYETFTADCPLFKKRIVIDAMETIMHSDDAFAPVAYLRFTQMHTEDKPNGSTESVLPLASCPCQSAIDMMTEETVYADKAHDVQEEFASNECQLMSSARSSAGYQWITGISGQSSDHTNIQSQTEHAFTILQGELQEKGWQMKHIVLVHLFVRDMEDFGNVNAVYRKFFSHCPPARVCVQARLPMGRLVQMDVLLHDWCVAPEEGSFQHRDTLHVQSVSHWAPANIGPYSQAVKVEEAIFCAGQIALLPCTMQLLRGGPSSQAQLCYSHVEKVLRAMSASLTLGHTLQAHCYVTDLTHIPAVRKVWHDKIQGSQEQEVCYGVEEIQCPPLVIAVMPSLPRGAAVELHVIAVQDKPTERTSCQMTSEIPGGTIHRQVLISSTRHYATLSMSVSLRESTPQCMGTEGILGAVSNSLQQALEQMEETLSPLCTRIFYKDSSKLATELSAGMQGCFKSRLGAKSPALVLVPVLELPDCTLLHLSCWLSK